MLGDPLENQLGSGLVQEVDDPLFVRILVLASRLFLSLWRSRRAAIRPLVLPVARIHLQCYPTKMAVVTQIHPLCNPEQPGRLYHGSQSAIFRPSPRLPQLGSYTS